MPAQSNPLTSEPGLESPESHWLHWAIHQQNARGEAAIYQVISCRKAELVTRAVLIHNEWKKLRANALDRASTAALSVGIIGPVVSHLYGAGPTLPLGNLVAWGYIWLFVAGCLHWVARQVLSGLR